MKISYAKTVEVANIALRALWRINARGSTDNEAFKMCETALQDIGFTIGLEDKRAPRYLEIGDCE